MNISSFPSKTAGSTRLVGSGPEMARLKERMSTVANSDANVLITGPTGVGKELVAREVHRLSPRNYKPLVIINCAAITETLLETELFGHTKGSFTGAHRDKKGRLEMANGGTILLDEIGETTLRMQSMLLRFLETGEIQTVGNSSIQTVDVRVITSTNSILSEKIASKQFREDLFFRLDVADIEVPPLKEHSADIPELIEYFSNVNSQQLVTCTDDTLELLKKYSWPGNVRELKSLIQKMHLRGVANVKPENLPPKITEPTEEGSCDIKASLSSKAQEALRRMLEDHESFSKVVQEEFLKHDLCRDDLRQIVTKGLEITRGSYSEMAEIFNLDPSRYKDLLKFLDYHDCKMDFRPFRERRRFKGKKMVES